MVISSATSWIVLHLVLGDEPLFHVPAYQLVHPSEFAVYAVLGVVGGLGSVFFVKLLLKIRTLFKRLPESTVWFQPAAGGLFVGLLGWYMPEVLGVGYDYVDRVLGGTAFLAGNAYEQGFKRRPDESLLVALRQIYCSTNQLGWSTLRGRAY